ncbi:FtsX-like permease family protein [Paraburkholderia bonniea]|uniref:ABC transporter permease n=1 Tax=Paraburkholderia bonniea TaxID=2152891 RepID=UPI0025731A03|nr:FtsX-like permease family protein [Paraburkholderia bonniea]WJF91528.1 FtsX-like permease family protein [Paraburkholderia bonniea]WJF94847.1 FtsX-like permease family protein [Paraburkholderia bonniea]
MSVLRLALRNLRRNQRRAATTLLAMIVGVAALLLFGGYTRNIRYGLETSFVRSDGQLQLQRRGYFLYGSGDPLAYGIRDYPKLIERLRHDPVLQPLLSMVTPVLAVEGIAGNFSAGVSRTVAGSGVVVHEQNRLREWNDYRFAETGSRLGLSGSANDAVVTGSGVARVLRLCGTAQLPPCEAAVFGAQAMRSASSVQSPVAVALAAARTQPETQATRSASSVHSPVAVALAAAQAQPEAQATRSASSVHSPVAVVLAAARAQPETQATRSASSVHSPVAVALAAAQAQPETQATRSASSVQSPVAVTLAAAQAQPGTAATLAITVAAETAATTEPADIAQLAADASPRPATGTIQGSSPPSARIQLLVANAYGAPNIADLDVIRTEKKAVKELDDTFVQMHLARAQQLVYGGEPPQVTSIVVQLHHTADMALARARIETLVASEALDVLDFRTLHPQYGQVTQMFGAVFGFIALLIATIVLFTVSNTMNMAVLERTAEIGTLRAIGMRRTTLMRMFVLEGLLLGLTGAGLGALVALLGATLVNHTGLYWVPPGQLDPVALRIRIWGENAMIWRVCAGMVVVAVLSSCWPAARAARLKIVTALHFA